LVLEGEYEEDFPSWSKKSTAGTFSKTLTEFGVPDDVLQNTTDRVVLESPNNSFEMDKSGAVMEFGDYKRWMAEDAQDKGAKYRFGAWVNGPVTDEDGNITAVRYNGDETVSGDIIIDATGPNAPLAEELDVSDLPREQEAIGVEYEMTGVDMERDGFVSLEDSMMLRLGHDWAPGGYSWIFHTGDDTAKVGVCYLQNQAHEDYSDSELDGIEDYMNRMLAEDPRLEDAEKIEAGTSFSRADRNSGIALS
ncbi:MAG: tryptophan 7-halogenase, partial [Candidatus Nanohaloarchaea archaeon]